MGELVLVQNTLPAPDVQYMELGIPVEVLPCTPADQK